MEVEVEDKDGIVGNEGSESSMLARWSCPAEADQHTLTRLAKVIPKSVTLIVCSMCACGQKELLNINS